MTWRNNSKLRVTLHRQAQTLSIILQAQMFWKTLSNLLHFCSVFIQMPSNIEPKPRPVRVWNFFQRAKKIVLQIFHDCKVVSVEYNYSVRVLIGIGLTMYPEPSKAHKDSIWILQILSVATDVCLVIHFSSVRREQLDKRCLGKGKRYINVS